MNFQDCLFFKISYLYHRFNLYLKFSYAKLLSSSYNLENRRRISWAIPYGQTREKTIPEEQS